MPKRTDINNILIIGSGPIVIGQGAEFDYSGTQACKALREEGFSVVLINSNPATIMTDPDMADRTYIEPITPEFIEKILIRERDDGRPVHALLPTLGGQTGLNCAMECHERGILARHNIEMIGATPEAIHKAENRTAFKETMIAIGLDVPSSAIAHTWDEARAILDRIKLPCCIRPAYTLGGEGGGFTRTMEEFETIAKRGLAASRVSEILIEESLYGWKEFELEVMRDRADNVVIICGIENLDPMGVHTGDSITVAPIQTLTDKEYQRMRDSAIAIIRAIGVETGGCNIQFAVEPSTGRQCVIEMNPRVSRSSALASKATGYPIARIAAKLAVGYTLDELPNDITKTTPASFEPTIDYVVVKMPRWTFEKFPDCDETLTTQMKSVGEAMAIGRTFKEAFQKCIRSMEIQRHGFGLDDNDAWLKAMQKSHEATLPGQAPPRSHEGIRTQTEPRPSGSGHQRVGRALPADKLPSHQIAKSPNENWQSASGNPEVPLGGATATEAPPDIEEEHAKSWPIPDVVLFDKLACPSQGRPYYIRYAFKMGCSVDQVHELTRIDPWFLDQMHQLVEEEDRIVRAANFSSHDPATEPSPLPRGTTGGSLLHRAKSLGYTNIQIAAANARKPSDIAEAARAAEIAPTYALVDTCAAEFEARTPYYYSSHETPSFNAVVPHIVSDNEIRITDKPKVVILGGGPNRIGQGIEFDYCCCHASFAARRAGFESVMVNSNPETVSTDFDTSDLLFFEPLTHEDVLNIVQRLDVSAPPSEPRPSGSGQAEPRARASGFPPPLPRGDLGGSSSSSDFELRTSNFRERDRNRVRGVIVQFGGQTPLNLAQTLKDAGVPILGTQPEMIHLAEDREQFQQVLRELSLLQPPSGIARTRTEARSVAARIGYPVLVRPSYVLGGRGMKICNNQRDLDDFLDAAIAASDRRGAGLDNPILIDKFLVDAIEVDVDAVADYGRDANDRDAAEAPLCHVEGPLCHVEGPLCHAERSEASPTRRDSAQPEILRSAQNDSSTCMVAGIMEHIEEAGIHSGDSTAVIPPFSLGRVVIEELFRSTKRLAGRLQVCGAMNVQYAILNRTVYVLEVNPRASRTLPFVAKATGVPWAQIATHVMLGEPLETVLARHGVAKTPWPDHTAIKAPVFPFHKFHGVDVILGPEMRSTGEVMAIAPTFGQAFAKAQIATGLSLPISGNALVSVCDTDKPRIVSVARELHDLGLRIFSTIGTRNILEEAGIPATLVSKSQDTHAAPFLLDLILDGTLNLLINTPIRTGPASAEGRWRAAATARHIPLITTIAGARAAVSAIRALSKSEDGDEPIPLEVRCLQAYFHQRT